MHRSYLFIYFYIYFWLCWVFVSVRGLSLVVASGDHSSSRCAGPFTIAASPVAEHRLQTRRLSSCGSRAQLLRGMWDPPRPGLEPVYPALAGRFSTTVPRGKPLFLFFCPSLQCWCSPAFVIISPYIYIPYVIFFISMISATRLDCDICETRKMLASPLYLILGTQQLVSACIFVESVHEWIYRPMTLKSLSFAKISLPGSKPINQNVY